MLSPRQFGVSLIIGGLAIVCCDSSDGTGSNFFDCDDLEDSVVLSLDEVSEEFGFSAQELLDAIDHEWETMIWIQEPDNVIANFPEEISTQMTVGIEYKGGAIREVYGDSLDCAPSFQIEVEIKVSTSCGLLDETWIGILNTDARWSPKPDPHEYVYLRADFDPADFVGSFEITGWPGPSTSEGPLGKFSTSFPLFPSGVISIHTETVSAYIFEW